MTLYELKLIQRVIAEFKCGVPDLEEGEVRLSEQILVREIRLKEMDPRKEANEKCET